MDTQKTEEKEKKPELPVRKFNSPISRIVCWVCRQGGNRIAGPLLKISESDYAHQRCFEIKGKPPIGNMSQVRFQYREEQKPA